VLFVRRKNLEIFNIIDLWENNTRRRPSCLNQVRITNSITGEYISNVIKRKEKRKKRSGKESRVASSANDPSSVVQVVRFGEPSLELCGILQCLLCGKEAKIGCGKILVREKKMIERNGNVKLPWWGMKCHSICARVWRELLCISLLFEWQSYLHRQHGWQVDPLHWTGWIKKSFVKFKNNLEL